MTEKLKQIKRMAFTIHHRRTVDRNAYERILSIDLKNVISKLCNTTHGLGWSHSKAIEAERKYKNFLYLVLEFPNEPIVPTKLIDSIWHAHILDTRSYYEDCMRVFGFIVHHDPFFGLFDDGEDSELITALARTKELYEFIFVEAYVGAEEAQICRIIPCKRN